MRKKDEIKWELIPRGLTQCTVSECSRSGDCLHFLKFYYGETNDYSQPFFHPAKPSTGEACPSLKLAETIKIPRGFMRGIGLVPQGQSNKLMQTIMERAGFSRGTFYHKRKGRRPLYHDEIEIITEIFASFGVDRSEIFDIYDEVYDL